MPSAPKFFIQGKPYIITFRTEEGLPFLPIPFINEIIWSCAAKAQTLYSQEVAAFTMEPNHGHLLLICTNPETVPDFIGYIKQESAHAINRLLGRTKKTIWAEGYDSPIILDYKEFLYRFAYVSLNPIKDQLVGKMKDYKGVSAWPLFMQNQSIRETRLISRDSITALNNPNQAWREGPKYLEKLLEDNKQEGCFRFDYYKWKRCFPETESMSDTDVRELMLQALSYFESEIRQNAPIKESYPDFTKQSLLKTYYPKKFGKKTICLSCFKELRQSFISLFKTVVYKAREVYLRWKSGDLAAKYPLGLFAPNLPRTANLFPVPTYT